MLDRKTTTPVRRGKERLYFLDLVIADWLFIHSSVAKKVAFSVAGDKGLKNGVDDNLDRLNCWPFDQHAALKVYMFGPT